MKQAKDYMQTYHHIGYVVKDLDRTIDFYINKLGFELFHRWSETPAEVQDGMGIPGACMELVQLKGYGALLEFYMYPKHPGPTTPIVPNHVGASHPAFLVSDLYAFVESARAEGIEIPDNVVELDTSRWVHIKDPDGIRIEIMEFFNQ